MCIFLTLLSGHFSHRFIFNHWISFSTYRVLQNSMAASYENQGPIPNYRLEVSIFYIVYFIVFPFFFVNIFVALIIITFQEQGEAELQDGGIDKNQVYLSLTLFIFFVNLFNYCIGFLKRYAHMTHALKKLFDFNLIIYRLLKQKSCIDFAINARPVATYIPPKRKKYKYKVWKMVVSTPFDYFIMLLIVLNTLLLMMKVNDHSSNKF